MCQQIKSSLFILFINVSVTQAQVMRLEEEGIVWNEKIDNFQEELLEKNELYPRYIIATYILLLNPLEYLIARESLRRYDRLRLVTFNNKLR